MRTNQRHGLNLVCKIHRHSDIEILNDTSGNVYHNIGQIHSLWSNKILTINKTVNL